MRRRARGGHTGPYFGTRCNAKTLSPAGLSALRELVARRGPTKAMSELKTTPCTLRKLLDGLPCVDKVIDPIEKKLLESP